MGKKLRVQRRGRGTPTYRARKMGKIAPAKYPAQTNFNGVVKKLIHEPGRGVPLVYTQMTDWDITPLPPREYTSIKKLTWARKPP
jgi:large subunit ribosomal protein L2